MWEEEYLCRRCSISLIGSLNSRLFSWNGVRTSHLLWATSPLSIKTLPSGLQHSRVSWAPRVPLAAVTRYFIQIPPSPAPCEPLIFVTPPRANPGIKGDWFTPEAPPSSQDDITHRYRAPEEVVRHYIRQVRLPCISPTPPRFRSQPGPLGVPLMWARDNHESYLLWLSYAKIKWKATNQPRPEPPLQKSNIWRQPEQGISVPTSNG